MWVQRGVVNVVLVRGILVRSVSVHFSFFRLRIFSILTQFAYVSSFFLVYLNIYPLQDKVGRFSKKFMSTPARKFNKNKLCRQKTCARAFLCNNVNTKNRERGNKNWNWQFCPKLGFPESQIFQIKLSYCSSILGCISYIG